MMMKRNYCSKSSRQQQQEKEEIIIFNRQQQQQLQQRHYHQQLISSSSTLPQTLSISSSSFQHRQQQQEQSDPLLPCRSNSTTSKKGRKKKTNLGVVAVVVLNVASSACFYNHKNKNNINSGSYGCNAFVVNTPYLYSSSVSSSSSSHRHHHPNQYHHHLAKTTTTSKQLFQSSRVTTTTNRDESMIMNPNKKIWDTLDMTAQRQTTTATRGSSSSSRSSSNMAVTVTPTPSLLSLSSLPLNEQQQLQQPATIISTNTAASIPKLMISLIKQVVGGSLLVLPASVATIGNSIMFGSSMNTANDNSIVIPIACGVIVSMGLICAYFFSLCGRVCYWTGATTFTKAWEMTVGPDSCQLVAIVLTMKTTLSCLTYALLLGNSFATIANNVGIFNHIVTSDEALHIIGLFILLPICVQQDLKSLTPFSFLGLLMILYTAIAIVYRSIDGTYTTMTTTAIDSIDASRQTIIHDDSTLQSTTTSTSSTSFDAVSVEATTHSTTYTTMMMPTEVSSSSTSNSIDISDAGQILYDIAVQSSTTISSSFDTFAVAAATTTASAVSSCSSNTGFVLTELLQGMALLGCTLISSFVAHYNAPRYYSELQNNTPERFNIVTGISYAIATIVFMAVAICGYTTFGSSTLPFILNNYNSNDTLLTIGNALVAISICLTFPLPFVGLRDGFYDSFQVPIEHRTCTMSSSIITGSLLFMIITLASYITDLSSVLSIGGGTFSTIVVAIFPTFMFRAAVQKQQQQEQQQEHEINDSNNNNKDNKDNINQYVKASINPNTNSDSVNHDRRTTTIIDYGNPSQNQFESNVAFGIMLICIVLGGTGVSTALNNVF